MPVRRTGSGKRSTVRRLLLPAGAAVVVGLVVALLGLADAAGGGPEAEPGGVAGAAWTADPDPGTTGAAPTATQTPAPPPPPPLAYPAAGPRTWRTAGGRGAVLGTAGRLLRFRVTVENGITGVTPDEFAGAVVGTLGDPRSWTGNGRWRLQRVGPGDATDFTIYLATPVTRGQLCYDASDRYTSCRYGDRVVINVARWAHGIPNYGEPLAAYRQYVVNHEVGHRLGHGHELCPGPGKLAPVMQQQTLSMHGCRPNSWPLRDGRLYAGRSGAYDDPIPAN
jgi:hypothetical protein